MANQSELKDALASAIRIRDAAEASYDEYVRELDAAQQRFDTDGAWKARQKMVGAGHRVEVAQRQVTKIENLLRSHNEAKAMGERHRYRG